MTEATINTDALADFLAEHIDNFEGPLSIKAFEAGQSNPTYKLTTPKAKYVLRRKPDGKLLTSAHAVDREFRVMSGVSKAGFPVPTMHVYAEEPDIVPTPFYVMSFVEGRVFWQTDIPSATPEERTAIFHSINKTMAQLHAIDSAAVGLDDFGKQGNYFARQIGRWSKQYTASANKQIASMDKLMAWLPNNIPADDETRIIHGDFGMHNIMFAPDGTDIVAILDWELSTLGHPIADVIYNMLPWYGPDIKGVFVSFRDKDLNALGIPSFDDYLAEYCERTGRPPLENPAFYRAYNLFRFAAIAQGIVGRALQGNASNPRAMQMEQVIAPLADMAWHEAKLAGAMA